MAKLAPKRQTEAPKRVAEALDLLRALNVPREQQNKRSAGWCVLETRGRLASLHSHNVSLRTGYERRIRLLRITTCVSEMADRCRSDPDSVPG